MGDESADATSDGGDTTPAGEDKPSWVVIGEKRTLRRQLDDEIAEGSYQAILDSRAAGVSTAELAALWGVRDTWIYTMAPVRKRSVDNGGSTDR